MEEQRFCTLYHFALSPFSRTIRLVLFEKNISYVLVYENPWERRIDFQKLNPACQVPVLIDEDGSVICDWRAICEYLDETRPQTGSLIGKTAGKRAEVRRLIGWFDSLFYPEVYETLVRHKVLMRLENSGSPSPTVMSIGRENLKRHLQYIEWLCERRKWLAGDDEMTLADLNVSAHLSVLDYLDEVSWTDYPETKAWYTKIKSRPSFRSLLTERIRGIIPPDSYTDLDF